MPDFKQYQRTAIAEMRPVHHLETLNALQEKGISVSQADINNGSPTMQDRIARNPKDHTDQWLVAEQYVKDNFKELT